MGVVGQWLLGNCSEHCVQLMQLMAGLAQSWVRVMGLHLDLPIVCCSAPLFIWQSASPSEYSVGSSTWNLLLTTPYGHSRKPHHLLLLFKWQLNHSSWVTYVQISYYFNTLLTGLYSVFFFLDCWTPPKAKNPNHSHLFLVSCTEALKDVAYLIFSLLFVFFI